MKYKVLINIAIAFLLIGALSAQEPVLDFRGLEWGEKRTEATFDNEMKPVFQREGMSGDRTVFSRVDENHTIGSVELNNIRYHFNEYGEFTRFVLTGNAKYNEDMESILLERLGPPTDAIMRMYEGVRVWEQENVTVVFKEFLSEDFIVDFRSKMDLRKKMEMNAKVDDF